MKENMSLQYIPQDIKINGLWCAWRLTERGKIPYNVVTGGLAKSNDPKTFTSYPTILNHLSNYLIVDDDGKMLGGLGLGIFNGFSAIDIDKCIDAKGDLSPMARDIIDFCQSYTEVSPSGRGIRIIFKTDNRIEKNRYYINNAKLGLEIYISDNTNKFVTITGNIHPASSKDIKKIDITHLLDKYMQKGNPLENAIARDEKMRDLWNAHASGSGGNESETDMALVCKLAFYLKGDFNAIDEAFRASPYYATKDDKHRAKWETRTDYRLSTINNAINTVTLSTANFTQTDAKRIYELNDTGNAHRFIDKFGHAVKYNVDNNGWMIWSGKNWQPDSKNVVKQYAEVIAEEMLQAAYLENDLSKKQNALKNVQRIYNSAGKESMLKEAEHLPNIPVTNIEFDTDDYILNTDSGVINLQTLEIIPHNKEYMVSMRTAVAPDIEHPPVRWLQFLNDILEGNAELINYLHKALGYALTGETKEQCMFVLYGDGSNGKSLLLDIVRETVGSYGITTRPSLLTEQRNGNTNTEEVARLRGKRVIFSEETKIGDKLDESLVKTLTSGIGNVVARFLYGNSFEFPVIGKIFMGTNHRPIIRGTDHGIWRRIHIIPFNKKFEGANDDKDLRYKLRAEKPQILGWLIQGCKLWQAEGLNPPPIVNKSTAEYRAEMDIVARWLDERCEIGDDKYEKANLLFQDFSVYAKTNKEYEMSMTLFGRNLVKKFERKRFGTGTVYMGLSLRKDRENLDLRVKFEKTKVRDDI